MNSFTAIGRLGADAEVKTSHSGESRFLTFSICENVYDPKAENNRSPLWYDCVVYLSRIVDGGLPALLTSGKEIAIKGDMRPNRFTPKGSDKEVTNFQFVVNDIELLRDKGSAQGGTDNAEASAPAPQSEAVPF